jgi:hypothetical protein
LHLSIPKPKVRWKGRGKEDGRRGGGLKQKEKVEREETLGVTAKWRGRLYAKKATSEVDSDCDRRSQLLVLQPAGWRTRSDFMHELL